ncbi:hypothetical protein PTKIN_Ptkin11bG0085700 [Pterospermum kingtungense]
MLRLTDKEKDSVESSGVRENSDPVEERCWLVAKLLTNRPLNREALMNTMKIVWRVSQEYEVSILDLNLFMFKFAITKDKEKGQVQETMMGGLSSMVIGLGLHHVKKGLSSNIGPDTVVAEKEGDVHTYKESKKSAEIYRNVLRRLIIEVLLEVTDKGKESVLGPTKDFAWMNGTVVNDIECIIVKSVRAKGNVKTVHAGNFNFKYTRLASKAKENDRKLTEVV